MVVYLCAKFEVCSIILTSFRQEGSNSPPAPPKQTPKKPTQIRVKGLRHFPVCYEFLDNFIEI